MLGNKPVLVRHIFHAGECQYVDEKQFISLIEHVEYGKKKAQ